MNTYFRLLQYAKPYKWLIPQYVVYTLLFVLFSVVNLAVLSPLLNLLFKPAATAATETTPAELNPWSLEQFYTYLNEFIAKAFNLDGSYKDTIFGANPSKWNCTFCPYKENTELCNAIGKNL